MYGVSTETATVKDEHMFTNIIHKNTQERCMEIEERSKKGNIEYVYRCFSYILWRKEKKT